MQTAIKGEDEWGFCTDVILNCLEITHHKFHMLKVIAYVSVYQNHSVVITKLVNKDAIIQMLTKNYNKQ